MDPVDKELEELLSRWSAGEREVLAKLIPLVYLELKERARRQLWREPHPSTLTPTELVNEAYMKLAEQDRSTWHNRSQFLAIASKCMQRILLDHARRRKAEKRPPPEVRVTLHTGVAAAELVDIDIMALNEALKRLERLKPDVADVARLRLFAGCNNAELVAITGFALATVKRHWTLAKAWMRKELGKSGDSKAIH